MHHSARHLSLSQFPTRAHLLTARAHLSLRRFLFCTLLLTSCALFLTACGSRQDEADDSKIKIGMVTDVGGINDKSFNQSSWEGLKELAAADDSFEVYYLESHMDSDYETNIYTFLDEGMDLIITVGYMTADTILEVAPLYPEQKFAIIDDSSAAALPNVACLTFSQEQAAYIAGIAAGLMTKTKKVGYLQGMVSENMNRFGVGYVSGVLAVCPEAEVFQYNANGFTDIAGCQAAARDMVTRGADVIFHAAGGGGIGAINAAEECGIWAIGVDTDQSSIAPEHVLTSAMKRVDNAVQDISLSVKDGTFRGGENVYDLTNGGVDIAPTKDNLPEDVLDYIEEIKIKIQNGDIRVPATTDECPAFTLDD